MFYSIQELVEQAKDYPTVGELMIATEMELTDRTREEIIALMERNLEVMESSIEEGIEGVTSVTGITGGDAKRMNDYIESGKFMSGDTILKAVRNGIAVNEVNAKMGLVCATPTAGSAGVLPGVLMAASEKLNLSHAEQIDFLFTAGAFGLVVEAMYKVGRAMPQIFKETAEGGVATTPTGLKLKRQVFGEPEKATV